MVSLTYLQVVFLAILQGITEFLPVSSSGHLKVAEYLFGQTGSSTFFDVILHAGTLLAIVLYFRKTILSLFTSQKKLLLLIIIASVPTAILGLTISKSVEDKNIYTIAIIAIFFIINGIILLSTRWARSGEKKIGIIHALLIGTAQGFGVFRGISRSGSTISAALHLGISREQAFDFSFLIALPAISGAVLLELHHGAGSQIDWLKLAMGFVISFVTGYLSLMLLKKIVMDKRFFLFGIYTFLLGIVLFFV